MYARSRVISFGFIRSTTMTVHSPARLADMIPFTESSTATASSGFTPIFSIGIRNKEGAASEKEFTIAKNIDGFRLRARGTGEFSAKTINLEATLKKASALLGDGTTPDATPDSGKDTGKDTPGGENTDQGGSGTTGEGGGDGLE